MRENPIRRALLSVSDKTGLIDFARGLVSLGVEIVSTGGTARALSEAGVPMIEIERFTGFPEMLDGRVKTLHPKVHGGILHRRDDPAHLAALEAHGIRPLDLVVVNLYPFEATVARPGVGRDEAVEQIDIGGPSMLRSAAKNHAHVTVISSPTRYGDVLSEMRALGGSTSLELRRRLALEAFRRTALYDAAISAYFARVDGGEAVAESAAGTVSPAALPERLEVSLPREAILRYGENPHQAGALYGSFLGRYRKLHGKEISYNNVLDLLAAEEAAECLGASGPAVVIIKHSNPCGAALGSSAAEAWRKALASDPTSASGGIVATSVPVDAEFAGELSERFLEVLVAPGYEPEALEILRRKKNRILLEVLRPLGSETGFLARSVPGGMLVQTPDRKPLLPGDLRVVTRRAPTEAELRALRFAWEVVRFVKSNAIVYALEDRVLGVGAGQMSRVDSARIGVWKAREAGLDLSGCAVASDAFFPFADGLIVAAEAGATAVIQPGESVRDPEVIAAADERGMAMVFTGVRHFRH